MFGANLFLFIIFAILVVLLIVVLNFIKATKSNHNYLAQEIRIIKGLLAKNESVIAPPLTVEKPVEVKISAATKHIVTIEEPAVIEKPAVVKKPVTIEKPAPIKRPFVAKPPRSRKYEKLFTENILSKIGIFTLVLGIGYFVKLSIENDWINNIEQVAIGLLVGASLIFMAHKIRINYKGFSALIAGGGIAVLYVTITLAFQYYHLISQPVAFVILILITVFSVLLSLLYDQKALAIFSLLGGFGAPLMISSNEGNYVVLFSYLLILNTGMLVLAWKRKWTIVSILSYILTLFFFWTWMIDKYHDQRAGALIFSSLFFIQFYTLALIEHFKLGRQLSWFQASIILGSNLSLFCTALYVYSDFPQYKGFITIILALINAVPMIILFKRGSLDKKFLYLLIAVVLTFITLAIPIQLNGSVITMFWAIEAVVLLWLFQKSKIDVFRLGCTVLQGLVILAVAKDLWQYYSTQTLITGLIVSASFFASQFLLNQEDGNSSYSFYSFKLGSIKKYTNIVGIVAIVILFFVLYGEINHLLQSDVHLEFQGLGTGVYTYLFLLTLLYLKSRKSELPKTLFFIAILAIVPVFLLYMVNLEDLRGHIFSIDYQYPNATGLFGLHLLYFPALWGIIYIIWKKAKSSQLDIVFFEWGIAIFSVIVLSMELDNLAIMLFNSNDNESLLKDVHTTMYPILWGIIAITLMIKGLKLKNVTLRRIALSLFGLIIAKLYLIDIWGMDKTQKIIALIVLGIIFLLASFIFQKLKNIVGDTNKTTDEKPNDKDESQKNI